MGLKIKNFDMTHKISKLRNGPKFQDFELYQNRFINEPARVIFVPLIDRAKKIEKFFSSYNPNEHRKSLK